jgi:signal recognition particle subunit SRP68
VLRLPVSRADTSHLHLVLFSAERALAYSHELKALAGKPNAPPSARREQISWLRRAHKLASSLHEIAVALAASDRLNQRTLAELTIYHLSVRAELSFERGAYAEVLAELAARRRLLDTLAGAARDSYDQALATEFIDAYDPLIRFSAYKLGRAESHDIEGVVADIDADMMEEASPGLGKLVESLRTETGAAELEAGRRTLEDVEFAGDKVEFRNAELVAAMIKVQEALGRVNKTGAGKATGRGGMKGWDRVLGVLGDAESVARRLLDDHEATASSTLRSTRTAQSLSFAHQYIVFMLLSHRIRRDLLLVDTLASAPSSLPADATVFKVPGGRAKLEEAVKGLAAVIKLYDTVLQSLSQARSLPIVEEKDGVRSAAEAAEAYFSATRCYNLARLHCVHPTPSYASAVQLLERAARNVASARDALKEGGLAEEIVPLTKEQVDALGESVDALALAAKRALFAHTVTKPVFYDSAFNYVDLPMEELLDKAGKGLPKMEAAPVPIAAPVPAKAAKATLSSPVREKREATPQPALKEEEEEAPAGKKGGWLGGWFGRG